MDLRWGLGVIVAVVAVVSLLVLSSYYGNRAEQARQVEAERQAGPIAPGTDETEEEAGSPNEPAQPAQPAQPVQPDGPAIPATGSGDLRVASFTQEAPGDQSGRKVRVRVETEQDMPTDPEQAAREIAAILQDQRSWSSQRQVHFDFVGGGLSHDLVIRILTPGTTDERCRPLDTKGEVSCFNGRSVNLNGVRWETGVPHFDGDVTGYRAYLVNHEVGHYLGLGHVDCPGPGQVAPIMMQQTKGLDGCTPNPWP